MSAPSVGSVSVERTDAFKEAMAADYPDITLVDCTADGFTQEAGLTMQFVQDKPYLFPLPDGTNVAAAAVVVFALISAGLMAVRYLADRNHSAVSSKGM